ncbi:MAG TPA: CoA pyrophosphatase [Actinocrinis sp.]
MTAAHSIGEQAGLAAPESLPGWLRPLAEAVAGLDGVDRDGTGSDLGWLGFRPPPRNPALPGRPRRSAVLILFGESEAPADAASPDAESADAASSDALSAGAAEPLPDQADVLVTTRAATLRAHAGQAAFPGGRIDPQDSGPVEAALREAHEEAGVEPGSVEVFGLLPELYLRPSDFMVTPVLGWWRSPAPLRAGSPLEVASVHRVAVKELAAPGNRFRVRHPSGYAGPAFEVDGLLVWGFTAGLLDAALRLGGWERAWDPGKVRELPLDVLALAARPASPAAPGAPGPAGA